MRQESVSPLSVLLLVVAHQGLYADSLRVKDAVFNAFVNARSLDQPGFFFFEFEVLIASYTWVKRHNFLFSPWDGHFYRLLNQK